MVTEKLKLLNDQSYFVVSDVSVVCPRCGARLAANRSPASLVPAGPGGFRCSPPRTRNAGAVGPHDPQVPVFRILLTRQLRTACAYRRTVAAGKVAGSFPRSGVRTTFACSSFLFSDRAAQSRTVRIAPHRVVPGLTVRPVLHCAVPGCSEAECSRRAVSQRPGRSVVLPCCALSYRSNAPYPCRASSKSNRSRRVVSCRSDRSAPRCAGSHGSARAALCGTGLFRGGVFAPRRIAASGSLRSVAVLCSVVPFKRSVLVPNHPVLPRSRRAGVQGMAYRGDGKSAPQPLSSPTGTAGRTVPMNRSRSLRPRSDRIRSETRGGSRSDAGDGSGECRKQQGAPWKAAPPSSRS